MITVIVPIYNTEKYLKRCIDSIINQTYKDLEIILVNDGSTDNSLNICNEYKVKDKRIKILNQTNQGQGVARNNALDICTGEYISFVDSDDYISDDMFEKMIFKINTYNADIAICGYCRDHGFVIKKPSVPKEDTLYNNIELIKEYITTPYITSSVCNKLYKKELWERWRFPSTRAKEDIGILYKVLSNVQKAVHIGESTYIQYVRPGSTERKKFSQDKVVSIEISKKRAEYIMKKHPELEKYVFLNTANIYCGLMKDIISSFSYFKYKNEYKEMLNNLEGELIEKSNKKDLNIKAYNNLKQIVNKQERFIILNILYGVKEKVLNIFTHIAFKIKGVRI